MMVSLSFTQNITCIKTEINMKKIETKNTIFYHCFQEKLETCENTMNNSSICLKIRISYSIQRYIQSSVKHLTGLWMRLYQEM